mgnify:CR=1 FL=1
MNLTISGHHLDVTPALREYVLTKLDRVTRHFEQVVDVTVLLSVEKQKEKHRRQKAEVNLHVKGKDIFVEAESEDMYATLDNLIDKGDYKRFYMHRTGHWLGMDVHDVGEYKVAGEFRELEPGMVFTIEPGLYIPPGSKGVPAKYQGIGIRIEDDVAITKDGHEVLTDAVPKSPDAVEALLATRD